MSGSRPEPDAVTASGGTAASATPSRAAICCLRWLTVARRSWLKVPLFEPPETAVPSATEVEGRVWKYGSGPVATGSIPISDDPAGVPFFAYTTEPSAGAARPGSRVTVHVRSG